jgi:cytochrome b subunit of formate dehydrogenase
MLALTGISMKLMMLQAVLLSKSPAWLVVMLNLPSWEYLLRYLIVFLGVILNIMLLKKLMMIWNQNIKPVLLKLNLIKKLLKH